MECIARSWCYEAIHVQDDVDCQSFHMDTHEQYQACGCTSDLGVHQHTQVLVISNEDICNTVKDKFNTLTWTDMPVCTV